MKDISHREFMINEFRSKPDYAFELCQEIFKVGSSNEKEVALDYLLEAFASSNDIWDLDL